MGEEHSSSRISWANSGPDGQKTDLCFDGHFTRKTSENIDCFALPEKVNWWSRNAQWRLVSHENHSSNHDVCISLLPDGGFRYGAGDG
jgi:hypothetical protein